MKKKKEEDLDEHEFKALTSRMLAQRSYGNFREKGLEMLYDSLAQGGLYPDLHRVEEFLKRVQSNN